jgi:hypothetical protein
MVKDGRTSLIWTLTGRQTATACVRLAPADISLAHFGCRDAPRRAGKPLRMRGKQGFAWGRPELGLEARGGQGRRESQASTRAPAWRPPSDFFVLEEVGKLARELISPNQGHKDCVCFASAALSKANIECYLVGSRCLSVPDLLATYLGPYLKLLRRTDYYLLLPTDPLAWNS